MNASSADHTAQANPSTAVIEAVADNIHRLRTASGWSIGELARQAEVGKATISSLEAGTGNPSVETLVAVSVALGVPFSTLISEPQGRIHKQAAGTGPITTNNDQTFISELRWTTGRLAEAEIYTIEMQRGTPYVAEPHPPGCVEMVLCVSGRVRTGPTTNPIELDAGDRATFPADQHHIYEALTKTAHIVDTIAYRTNP